MTDEKCDRAFFAAPTLTVAEALLGCTLVREEEGGVVAGRIVETEAYTQDDPAFLGWGSFDAGAGLVRMEGRTYDLFGLPGTAYIYRVYQRHWLLNVVTEPEGVAGCVLLRAVAPVAGRHVMEPRRPAARRERDLTNGPGKLTQAFGLDRSWHGHDLTTAPLTIRPRSEALHHPIARSSRIGLSRGIDRPYRFYLDGHPCVSPGTPSDVAAARRRGAR